MKLALVISTGDASFDALAFKGDLLSGVRMAKEIGYDAVEIAIRDPRSVDVEEIKGLLDDLGMKAIAVGTGQALLVEKLNMIDPDPEVRRKTVERLKLHTDFASAFGAFLIIGFIRGLRRGRSKEEVEELFVSTCREIADYAAQKDVRVVIEPLNRYEIDFINTVDEALQLINAVDRANVGLLADTFHMNIEEPCISESIKKAGEKLFHFHVADSNRWAPGSGHLNFRETFEALKDIGYSGYISVECMPLPENPRVSAELAYRTLSNILKEMNA
ncbi:MAG TPA: sugar phosphate isomerase/epimerase [Thermotogae bacterium]|nr:sugar phosphate isomerase/epimerase [Thermotogota bacterium]